MKKEKLQIHYDQEGDFLEIRIGKPAKGIFEDMGDDIFRRIEENSGKINGLAIFNFKKRTKLKDLTIDLPVELKLS